MDYLSGSPLISHDLTQKFTPEEFLELKTRSKDIWQKYLANVTLNPSRISNLQTDDYRWGQYPDSENYVHTKSAIQNEAEPHLLATANLETSADLLSLRTILNSLANPETILATMYFPYTRADRAKLQPDGYRELVFLDTVCKDLFSSGLRGIILVDPHSPAVLWYCLKSGIAPLLVTAIPALITAAQNQFQLSQNVICASPDEGGRSLCEYTAGLLGQTEVIFGSKIRTVIGADVTYSPADLLKVSGKTVIFTDDVISTGATLSAAANVLLKAGAAHVIILATYSIFSGSALKDLGFNPKIKIFTTDGFRSVIPLSQSENIIVVPLKPKLPQLLSACLNSSANLSALGFGLVE